MEGLPFLHRDEATWLALPTRRKGPSYVEYGAPWDVYAFTGLNGPYYRVTLGRSAAEVLLAEVPYGSDEHRRVEKWVSPDKFFRRHLTQNPRSSSIVTLDQACTLLGENAVR